MMRFRGLITSSAIFLGWFFTAGPALATAYFFDQTGPVELYDGPILGWIMPVFQPVFFGSPTINGDPSVDMPSINTYPCGGGAPGVCPSPPLDFDPLVALAVGLPGDFVASLPSLAPPYPVGGLLFSLSPGGLGGFGCSPFSMTSGCGLAWLNVMSDEQLLVTGWGNNSTIYEATDFHLVRTTGNWEVVPEPATLTLLGSGLLGLAMMRRRKHSADSV
jgi:hypothetical protein